MITQCLEPSTCILKKDSALIYKAVWDKKLTDFQELTETQSASELLQVRAYRFIYLPVLIQLPERLS
jgi:hypothetical protein